MLYWSAIFLLVACAAGFMGITGVAGVSAQDAWGLFLASAVLAVLSLLLSHKREGVPLRNRNFRRDPPGNAGGNVRGNLRDV